MDRILRGGEAWHEAVAEALARAPRPIPLDERLLPRMADGESNRGRYGRGDFPPAREASTLLALSPDAAGEPVIPLTVRHGDLRAREMAARRAASPAPTHPAPRPRVRGRARSSARAGTVFNARGL